MVFAVELYSSSEPLDSCALCIFPDELENVLVDVLIELLEL